MDERYTPSETYLNRPYAIILSFIEFEKIKCFYINNNGVILASILNRFEIYTVASETKQGCFNWTLLACWTIITI